MQPLTLFKLILALALAVAPMAMGAAPAAAMDHQVMGAMMHESGDCQPMPDRQPAKMHADSCCVAMCAAMIVEPPALDGLAVVGMVAVGAPPSAFRGFVAEIEPPPPRTV